MFFDAQSTHQSPVTHRLTVPLLLLAVIPSTAHATDWVRLPLAALSDKAGLIAAGTAAVDGEVATIRVEDTFKGPRMPAIALPAVAPKSGRDRWVRDGMKGVF